MIKMLSAIRNIFAGNILFQYYYDMFPRRENAENMDVDFNEKQGTFLSFYHIKVPQSKKERLCVLCGIVSLSVVSCWQRNTGVPVLPAFSELTWKKSLQQCTAEALFPHNCAA